jgi:hypothetical protein
VKNRSLLGDLKILVATVAVALGRRVSETGPPKEHGSTI